MEDQPSALLGPAAGRAAGAALVLALAGALLADSVLLRLAAAWVAAEAAYFLLFRQRYAAINTIIHHPADPLAAASHMAHFLELAPVMCIRDFMSGWFKGVPFSEVKRGNVQDFVAYGFYQSKWEDLDAADAATASRFVDDVEKAWGIKYPPGRNAALSFMAHLWEPLRAVPKPLAVHAAAEVGSLACRAALWSMGFRRKSVLGGGFDYWVRPAGGARGGKGAGGGGGGAAGEAAAVCTPTPPSSPPSSPPRRRSPLLLTSPADDGSSYSPSLPGSPLRGVRGGFAGHSSASSLARGDSFTSLAGGGRASLPVAAAPAPPPSPSKPRPIAFIHGVGLGIFPYLGLIWQVVATHGGGREVLLLEVPHVALGAAPRRAATVDSVADASIAMLAAEGHADACFAAHSYGTFCVSRACQRYPGAVASTVLIDPVCLLTCHPRLVYSFVYHSPGFAALCRGGLREVLGGVRYLFSRDLTIAETFCRQFLWHELTLWPGHMPPASLVALAHGDDLVPSPLVARHLAAAAPGAKVMYHPSAGHGGVLLDWGWQAGLVEEMGALLEVAPRTLAVAAEQEKAALPPAAPAALPAALTTTTRRATTSAADDTAGEGEQQPTASVHRRRHTNTNHRRRHSALIGAGRGDRLAEGGEPAAPTGAAALPRRLFRRMAEKRAGNSAEQEAVARGRSSVRA